MKYKRLGTSDLVVSEVCLGTMTWGIQNTEADAHAQLDYARHRGVNFVDTAEMYPVPLYQTDQVPGTSERYIGSYLVSHSAAVRRELIISTKVMGYKKRSKVVANRSIQSSFSPSSHIVNNKINTPTARRPYPDARLDAASIISACTASLRRLQTTYIDLYVLHWSDRYTASFGHRTYDVRHERRDDVPIRDTLLALRQLLNEGKIRAYGLSNESTFGLCQFVREADALGMPRPASIQNPFCLLDRQAERELAEACSPRHLNVAFMPWSVLAGGTLTGKYRRRLEFPHDLAKAHKGLENARYVRFNQFMQRFHTEKAVYTAELYERIATQHGLSLASMAIAFCCSRAFVTASVIGATKLEQLRENIDAFDVRLEPDLLRLIDEVHNENKDVAVTA